LSLRIAKVQEDAVPHISGGESAEGRSSDKPNNLSQVLRVHAGGEYRRTDQVREHYRDLAALGFVPWAQFGPRHKLGPGGGRSGKLGNCPEQSPAISRKHAAKFLLELLVREVLKDRKIDPVLGKAVRILGLPERS
jgi:hypothetical protein